MIVLRFIGIAEVRKCSEPYPTVKIALTPEILTLTPPIQAYEMYVVQLCITETYCSF